MKKGMGNMDTDVRVLRAEISQCKCEASVRRA